jgi:hypothetical protein
MSRRFKGAIPGKNARIAARTWVLPDAFPG